LDKEVRFGLQCLWQQKVAVFNIGRKAGKLNMAGLRFI
jgi:hypothetical protein